MDNCIVNISVGSEHSWYHRGQERLVQSLVDLAGDTKFDILTDCYEEPKTGYVYEDKIMAVYNAAKKGYKKILWLDCSITAVKSIEPIWEWLNDKGYYLYQSGANCAETCNDASISFYGLNRDKAEEIHECASNVVGFNLETMQGYMLLELWTRSLNSKINRGCKWCGKKERRNESLDPRFKYHRQDQSTLSLSAGTLNLKLESEHHFVSRAENGVSDTALFKLAGGF